MGVGSQDAIKQFQEFIDQVEEPLRTTFKNVHQGFVTETLMRFLKARDWDPYKAQKMLVDCLNWRVQNEIDNILSKPIFPADLYRAVRDSQLIGLSGYSREGLPVIGVGLSTFDKASVHYYMQSHIQINEYRDRIVLPSASEKQGRPITTCIKVLDMTGLKLSALNQIKLLTIISSIDDLNYPEKTNTYYIVNAPYIFSACWKVVKPLLQERTKRKIQVLPGCGRDELLTIMDYSSLPHLCRREGSGSSRHSESGSENCYSLDHPFHQGLYNHIKQQARLREAIEPITIASFFSTKSSHSLAFALHASNSSFDILILPLNLEYGTLPTSDKILISLTALCSAAFASLASTRTSSSFSSASSATALDFSTSHFSS